MIYRIILTLFIFSSSISFSIAQTAGPFIIPESNQVWRQYSSCWVWDSMREQHTASSLKLDGQTITVDGEEYWTMQQMKHYWEIGGIYPEDCNANDTSNTLYPWAIREDSGYVYAVSVFWGGPERLIYNMNAQVGDTVPDPVEFAADTFVVSSIDSVPYGSEYLTRWWLDNGAFIVERVGGSNGFASSLADFEFCGTGWLCYGENDSVFYPEDSTSCDFAVYTVGVEQHLVGYQKTIVQYESESVTISTPEFQNDAQYILVNSVGQIIKQGKFNGRLQFSNYDYKPGIYFVNIFSSAGSHTHKILLRR